MIDTELEKISPIHYRSEYGYFMQKERKHWVFLPFEKEFDTDSLLSITDILRNLNEQQYDS